MKKYLYTLLLIAFITPSVALASWWNPFSWGIFHRIDITTEKTKEDSKELDNRANLDSLVKDQTSDNKEGKAQPPPVIDHALTEVQLQPKIQAILKNKAEQDALTATKQTAVTVQPPNTTYCNGQYWNNCPAEQNFSCPTTGSAKCIISSPISEPTPVYPTDSSSLGSMQDYYFSLGRNKGVVVFSESGCDYYLVETSLGYSLLEWYGGFWQSEGDIIYGNLNSYGFEDLTNSYGSSGRVWIDDYMLSKSRAIEKYYDKCD